MVVEQIAGGPKPANLFVQWEKLANETAAIVADTALISEASERSSGEFHGFLRARRQ